MSARHLLAGLLLALLGAAASAQTPAPTARAFALQTYEPPPAGDRFFTLPGTGVPGHLVPTAALVLSFADEPLVLQRGGETIPGGRIVQRQLWGFLQASLGLGDRLLLDLSVPVALHQSGSQPIAALAPVATSALGDLKLGARTPLPRFGPLALAAALDLWLPTGSIDAFASDGSFRVQPKVVASGSAGPLEYGGTVGYLQRTSSDRVITRTGPAITFGVGGAWRTGAWRFGPELFGRFQLEGENASPVEALVGGHWQRGAIDAGLALGTGLDRAPGAAPVRLVAQVSWRPPARSFRRSLEPAAQPAAAVAPPEATPAAPPAAEPAPEPAPSTPVEPPATAEATAVEPPLPAQPETEPPAAEPARDGAPAAAEPPPALVKLTRDRIEILQSVQFETARDVIRPESERLLGEVAQVLVGHPELTRVGVEGHTDAKGSTSFNVVLSEKRAIAVKRWLVERGGVDATRLDAEGFGPARPLDSNDTEEGRARNRRVEFRIVERR